MFYDKEFFQSLATGAERSARAVVPIVLDLVRPHSVIDVGCGDGHWLSVFEDLGIKDIQGIDGDYVSRETLRIPQEKFFAADLSMPFKGGRQYDLVMSLEVAEHLPEESAGIFIDTLTRLGPMVLFSAAVPFQGGTNHINEQWPEYWAQLFQMRNYTAVDCMRSRLWNNDSVDWWYSQNMFLFIRSDKVEEFKTINKITDISSEIPSAIVHPRHYLAKVKSLPDNHHSQEVSIKSTLKALARAIRPRAF